MALCLTPSTGTEAGRENDMRLKSTKLVCLFHLSDCKYIKFIDQSYLKSILF